MAVKRSSVALLGLCIVVLVAMQAVDQVAAQQCVPGSLSVCGSALQGAYPNTPCCNAIKALGAECLCNLYSQYSRGQSPAQIQRAKDIVTLCLHLTYGFKCA